MLRAELCEFTLVLAAFTLNVGGKGGTIAFDLQLQLFSVESELSGRLLVCESEASISSRRLVRNALSMGREIGRKLLCLNGGFVRKAGLMGRDFVRESDPLRFCGDLSFFGSSRAS